METGLIVIEESKNPIELFKPKAVDGILKAVERRAEEELEGATLETAAGRKVYASVAFKVAKSKTFLDSAGKELVSDWKRQAKDVDAARKQFRDALDDLKVKVRQPLTEWEEAKAEEEARKKAEAEYQAAWDEAIKENEQVDRLREIERREAELIRQKEERREREEAERRAREEAERRAREEAERAEREKRIAAEAEARAKAEAEAALKQEQEARIAAELKAKADAEAAKKRAEEEKAEAIRQERERQATEARAKTEAEARAKAEAERKSRDKKHRAEINREAMRGFTVSGIPEETAKEVIRLIASGKIRHISIQY